MTDDTVPKYKIVCLDDILQIPADRLEFFLRDFEYAIQMTHLAGLGKFVGMEWRDDGDHSVDLYDMTGKKTTADPSRN